MSGSARDGMVRPVLKWAGGKAWLAERVRALLPARIEGVYHEPFAGGLAVFASLRPEQLPLFSEVGSQHVPAHRARLCDISASLVRFYEALRDQPEEVIRRTIALRDGYLPLGEDARAEYYGEVRAELNVVSGWVQALIARDRSVEASTLADLAARYLFVNKVGYNGLMRYNRRGALNTPHGRYRAPRVVVPEQVRAFARALRGVSFDACDFEASVAAAGPGDAAYLDPPHARRTTTSGFTEYGPMRWTEEDDERCAAVFWALARRGVRVVMSQADTPRSRELLGAAYVQIVMRRGTISCRADGRGALPELLASAGPSS